MTALAWVADLYAHIVIVSAIGITIAATVVLASTSASCARLVAAAHGVVLRLAGRV